MYGDGSDTMDEVVAEGLGLTLLGQ